MRFRFPLRITLLGTNLLVFLVTFAFIWLSATQGLESSVYGMAESLTVETLARVKEEANQPLQEAEIASKLAKQQLSDSEKAAGRPLTMSNADSILSQFRDIMSALPRLSFLSCSFDATGEYLHVERRGNELEAVKVISKAGEGATHYSYRFVGNRLVLKKVSPNYRYDPRQRPYYKAALAAHGPVWTDPYLFVNLQGARYPGLSLATPMYAPSGRLQYVLTADFSCQAVAHYLRQVRVGETGYAYVLAKPEKGPPILVAHPRLDVLLQERNGQINLVDSSHISDPVLKSIMPLTLAEAKRQGGSFALSSTVNNREYFLGYEGLGAGRLGVGLVVPANELTGSLSDHQRYISLAGMVALGLGIAMSMLISTSVSRPLQNAVVQLRRAGNFELETPRSPPSLVAEVDDLGHGIEAMKLGLGSFARYVPADLVRRMLDSGTPPEVGGDLCELTIHFCDVVGFSSVAEVLAPDQLFKLLSELLSELSDEIARSGGTVDKYIGDNIMAFWGAPEPLADHAALAVRTALRNQARLEKLRNGWRERGLPELSARIGLHTGHTVVGNIGSSQRLNYTTLGDAVNVASRLEGLNKLYGTGILISDRTREAAGKELLARPIDWVGVAGREKPLMIYEPLGFAAEMEAEERQFKERLQTYAERALSAYRLGHWPEAGDAFSALARMQGRDPASELMLARCRVLAKNPPRAHWDGVFRTSKASLDAIAD